MPLSSKKFARLFTCPHFHPHVVCFLTVFHRIGIFISLISNATLFLLVSMYLIRKICQSPFVLFLINRTVRPQLNIHLDCLDITAVFSFGTDWKNPLLIFFFQFSAKTKLVVTLRNKLESSCYSFFFFKLQPINSLTHHQTHTHTHTHSDQRSAMCAYQTPDSTETSGHL